MSSKGKVLGSFAMYYREPRIPNGDERLLTDVATQLAARAIEHRVLREQPK
jgi:GAF domain-containing protein